jgi:predicted TIM-barrel fold metal-dependent hydrolase
VIDADAHVVEPFEIWQQRLPAEFHHLARRREVDEQGREQLYHLDNPLELEWTVGTLSTPGSASEGGRLDFDLDSEVHPGAYDPARRIELMDEQGIAVSVLFPSITLGLDDVAEQGYRQAHAVAYNDWVADFCAEDPLRLLWGAVIPLHDPAWAGRELERCLARGASCAMLSPIPRSRPSGQFANPTRANQCQNLGHRELDPIYQLLAQAQKPAVVHAVNPASNALGIGWVFANRTQWQMGQPFQVQLALLHLLDGGVLERIPDLKVGFFEGDVGWLPHWLGRLTETYSKFALLSRRPTKAPIDQFRRSCVISGEPADLGLASATDLVGADRVLWASDWPHMDGAWPDPMVILRDREDLSQAQKRAMFVEGAADFFAIDLDALLAHLGDGWSLSADVADLAGMGVPDRLSW